MLKALVTASVLLAVSIGVVRLHGDFRESSSIVTISVIAVTVLVLLHFGHLELALTAIAPILLSFTAAVGVLGWCGARIERSDVVCMLIGLMPATSYSVVSLGGLVREFRGKKRFARWMLPLLLLTLIVMATCLWFLKLQTGTRSNLVQIVALIASVSAVIMVWQIVHPVARLLLSDDANSNAHESNVSMATDLKTQVRLLYRYLDVPAEQYVIWKLRLDPIFAHIDEAAPPGGKILDAGCGFGITSNLLALSGPSRQVVGIDMDGNKLRVARRSARRLRNVLYRSGNLLDGDFPPADCILLIDALHYWHPEKQARIIARCAASLTPGGTIVFREAMQSASIGHRIVHWAEKGAVRLGHNPRGDGLLFQTRDFYLRQFAENGVVLDREPPDWGRGSNAVFIFRKKALGGLN